VSKRLLVLGWHNVAGTYGFPSRPGAGQRGFAQQMRTLSRTANVLPLNEALERLAQGAALPSRAVAITFDDGYADNLTLAVPILERLGLAATFFLVPGLLSGETDAWWETLGWAIFNSPLTELDWEGTTFTLGDDGARRSAYERLVPLLKFRARADRDVAMSTLIEKLSPRGERPRLFMDWDGARELVRRGFSVESHTCSHPVLSQETPAEQQQELAHARTRLEEKLEIEISTLAYPHGGPPDYNAETLSAAQAAGYTWAITTREGFSTDTTPPLEIRRCVVYPERGVIDLLAQLRFMLRNRLRGGGA
jgi:peptidoglycan/xylan/chitin deacetylase (PgdA/CDA1 family)